MTSANGVRAARGTGHAGIRAGILVVSALLTASMLSPAFAGGSVGDQTSIKSQGKAMSLYDLSAKDIDGKNVPLKSYEGKVALVVNVASECGFTPQYEGLQKLFTDNKDRGLVVLGFPSNEFGGQEPGTEADIKTFCSTKFHVTFPMFSKVSVKKGDNQSPVYQFLTESQPAPRWNFSKYLIGKHGQVLGAFSSQVTPDSAELKKAIDAALADS